MAQVRPGPGPAAGLRCAHGIAQAGDEQPRGPDGEVPQRKRPLGLTKAGRAAQATAGDYARPWEHTADCVPAVHKLLSDGVDQTTDAGTLQDKSAAAEILADTRRALYRLLARRE